ncbi:MAG TPA: GDSL-type esterase/lipase family protein, partial [Gammaproteobacteria bacterium]|nr:GDSL-type esterase/lipase family protein [Gammaproteobacteria bacterium]
MINAVTQPVIVVLGDSLSTGYGIELNQGWVAQLQQRLRREGYPHRVVNASIGGETTRGALA